MILIMCFFPILFLSQCHPGIIIGYPFELLGAWITICNITCFANLISNVVCSRTVIAAKMLAFSIDFYIFFSLTIRANFKTLITRARDVLLFHHVSSVKASNFCKYRLGKILFYYLLGLLVSGILKLYC